MSETKTLEDLRWKSFPVLDDGSVCLVDAMGDDQRIVDAARPPSKYGPRTEDREPEYLLAIKDAFAAGYRVDTENGIIYGLKGRPLKIALRGSQNYPTVSLATPNMRRRFCAVPAHKVAAFAIWGDAAFARGTAVRHLSDVCDIRSKSLALGTNSQNEFDKPPEARSRAARIARQAQGPVALNRKMTFEDAEEIRGEVANGPRGTRAKMAAKHGVDKSTITRIVERKIYVEPGL